MDIYSEESIVLKIGDLKLSDTRDTFGKKRDVNGYQYIPLEDPKAILFSDISNNLAHGDSREGVSIRSKDDEIFLIFGANRSGSNAQSMAIGYYNGGEYFFIDECFGDIYSEKPRLSSRRIVRCQSLWKSSKKDIIKNTYNYYDPNIKEELTSTEKKSLIELLSKIQSVENGLTKESLSNLRLKEIFFRNRNIEQPCNEER